MVFLVAQVVNNWPAMEEARETQKIQVWSLGREDPQEKEMATHCSILAWEIQWIEEPGGLQSKGSQRVGHGHDWATEHTCTPSLTQKGSLEYFLEAFLFLHPYLWINLKTFFSVKIIRKSLLNEASLHYNSDLI